MSRFMGFLAGIMMSTGIMVSTPGLAEESSALKVTKVVKQTVPKVRSFQGNIEAINQATVSSQTSGRVTQINFDIDDTVEKGDIILQVKDTEQRSNYDAALASLKEAQARAKEAASEYQRIQEIYQRKLVSRAAFDKAKADDTAAKRRLDAARAKLKQAEEQLEYTRVRAPYSGIVVERFVEVGETMTVGQPLIKGISLEQLRVVTHIPQQIVNTVRDYRQARVMLPITDGSRDEQSLVDATSITISPYAEENSHTFQVRVKLPEGLEGLYPGMFCKVGFVVGEEQRLVVPKRAIIHRSEVTGVYVLDEANTLMLRKVRIGEIANEQEVVVLSGLSEGERVVLDPVRAAVVIREQRQSAAKQSAEDSQ